MYYHYTSVNFHVCLVELYLYLYPYTSPALPPTYIQNSHPTGPGWVLKCISFWHLNLPYYKNNLSVDNECKCQILSYHQITGSWTIFVRMKYEGPNHFSQNALCEQVSLTGFEVSSTCISAWGQVNNLPFQWLVLQMLISLEMVDCQNGWTNVDILM